MVHIFSKIGLLFIYFMCVTAEASSLPKGTQVLDVTNYTLGLKYFEAADSIFVNHGKYIRCKSDNPIPVGKSEAIVQIPYPEGNIAYSIWVRAKSIKLKLTGANPVTATATAPSGWHWIKLGRFSAKKMGDFFYLFAMVDEKKRASDASLDCVLLTPDDNFKPSGIYVSVQLGKNANQGNKAYSSASQKNTAVETVNISITLPDIKKYASKYIASANCHGAKRHCLDNNPMWDKMMKRFFSDNLLVLLTGSLSKPDKDGNWWRFADIDRFIRYAKTRWNVENVMILPQWRVRIDPKSKQFEKKDLDKGRERFLQLVRRYEKPGELFVKYWTVSDEWFCGSNKNTEPLAAYYASLVSEMKKINSNLLIGGPVDCWPNSNSLKKLLEKCPELDFIAWNMFTTGRADYPLDRLFDRTSYFYTEIQRSRKLAKEILKRDIPVMVSSYGPNYHSWDPPDYRQVKPVYGIYDALALTYMYKADCFAGVWYNVLAKDAGLFGPRDGFAIRAGMIPKDHKGINVRPSARVHEFFKQHMAGSIKQKVTISKNIDKLAVCAGLLPDGKEAIVMVNFAPVARLAKLKVEPFLRTMYNGLSLPTKYLYCDRASIRQGEGLFFDTKGNAQFYMPAYSTWLLTVHNPAKNKNGVTVQGSIY